LRIYSDNIFKLATLHKRHPGKILRRLLFLKVIKSVYDARGYDDYLSTYLYNIMHNKETQEINKEIPIVEQIDSIEINKEEQIMEQISLETIEENSVENSVEMTDEEMPHVEMPHIDQQEKETAYLNTFLSWTTENCEQLIVNYKIDKLSLMELARIHNRHPDIIVHKLRDLKIIKTLKTCAGYDIYKKSQLYKDYQKIYRRKRKQ
jgi:hypothetical protein